MRVIVLILCSGLFFSNCFGAWFADRKAHNLYVGINYKKACDILEKEQVDYPDDALINYNLGVLYYSQDKLKEAKNNFKRAAEISFDKNKKRAEHSYFNWGNCFLKNTLNILGKDWKTKKLEESKLNLCKNELKSAIEKYQNAITFSKKNTDAAENKKTAEELLKQLEQKEQQQDQQDKNKQDDKKDDKKQDQDKSKQDKSGSKEDNKQDGEDKQDNRDDGSDERDGSKKDGQDNKSRDEKAGSDKKDVSEHDTQTPDDQKEEQSQNSTEQDMNKADDTQEMEKAGTINQDEQNGEEDMEMKGLKVMLDKLQKDEAKLQKMIMMQKSKSGKPKENENQKPW